ncbi:MAG: DUF3500 domain-containing protein [Opitutae bacterium]|jgi:hypothetical protein|nr:DUF3500 domain-containing protein [Opitutae bacterium]
MKINLTRFLLSTPVRLLLAGLICASPITTQAKDGQAAASMAKAATELLASLDTEQKDTVTYEFGDKTRDAWHFFPNWAKRSGIPLSQLSKKQREPVMQMLTLLLTSDAFKEQENIRLIHGLKKDLNDPNNPRHLYFISIFGKPSVESTWGWRFEGHHLSINCTLGGGKNFSVTPSFWGASPVRVTKGDHKGLEVFAREQAVSLSLVNSLSAKQKKLAGIKSGKGPGPTASVSRKAYLPKSGIPYSGLNESQQKQLKELVLVFAGKYRPELVKQIDGRKKILDTSSMSFSFVAPSGDYVPHYRIQTKEYLIEFDNRSGGHVHSAWRDFDGDFGRDVISEHLKKDH